MSLHGFCSCVCALDMLSIHSYSEVDAYRRLRSEFVAPMLEHFFDEEIQKFIIIGERGGITLEEYLSSKDSVCRLDCRSSF